MTGGKGMKDRVDRSRENTDPHSRIVLSRSNQEQENKYMKTIRSGRSTYNLYRSNQEQENKYMKTIRSGRSTYNLYSGRLHVVLWNNCFLLRRNKDTDWNSMKNFSLVDFRSPSSLWEPSDCLVCELSSRVQVWSPEPIISNCKVQN